MISDQRWQPLGCSRVTCNEMKTNSFSTSPFLFLGGGGEVEVGKKHFFFPEMSITLVAQLSVLPVKEVSHQIPNQEAPVERGSHRKDQLILQFEDILNQLI